MFLDFDYKIILDHLPFLLEGMLVTLKLTALAIVGGILGGTLLAVIRVSNIWLLSPLAAGYVNLLRATPLILVIFWFYFLVPLVLGRAVGGFYSVLIAFILFEAAYYCEIIRAGLGSVGKGQLKAGQALGLSYVDNMRYVLLPQAFRNMMPILVTQAIILFQDTSLVYVVGVKDFLVSADIIANRDNRITEMYLTVALTYLVLCLIGSAFVNHLKRKNAS